MATETKNKPTILVLTKKE